MPIRHFDNLLYERKQFQTHPLSLLTDSRLGIDASYYLKLLTESPPSREPLLAATGGLPLALTQRIESDLRALEKLRIKPVFVFPGLAPNRRGKSHQQHQFEPPEAARDRREAWSKYESGHEEAATKLFEARGGLHQWDLWKMVLRIFRHRNVEFIVAPYIAWAQLIYLQRHPNAYIHAIFGPTDTLLYPGMDKLITSLDLTSANPSFTFVSKRNIIADLGLSEDQFLDVGILVGFDHAQPFPPTMHEQAVKQTIDMVKYYKTGQAAVSAFADHAQIKVIQYPELYARTRAMVKYSLVLTSEGTVQPLPIASPSTPHGGNGPSNHHHPSPGDVPSDLHDVFTHRLPDEVYYYLSRGLLGPQALVWLTSNQIVENPPLDNGETTEYRRFVREVITEGSTGPRATALVLISSVCNQFWTKKNVTVNLWFEQGGPPKFISLNQPQTVQLAERVSGWSVPYAVVEEELRRQNSSTIDFALCLGATISEKLAARTKVKAGHAPQTFDKKEDGGRAKTKGGQTTPHLDKKDEVVANVIWRFLELRGFLLNTHVHSPLARAMYVAMRIARVNDKFQDSLYLFLELVRAGVMHGHLWSGQAFSGGPSFGTDDEKSCMLLVMRVLSIVPLSFKPQPWSAPLSRELLVFNSFVRSLTRALRTLLEVTSLNMLVRQDARQSRDDLLDINLSLPFQSEVNTGFGVLAKVYLDALTHINNGQRVRDPNAEGVKDAKLMALEICEETFPGVKGPKQEVERGFRFWDVTLTAMRQLHSEGAVLREMIDQFEAAEAWLAPMRP
ncbi:XPG I-region protein [Cristinia sonorae]|uniref:XPG I-region protein n=1 Tax=Cristinia sonorae TaxID=1940300 RepID=A0A8K0XT48_9AGAR|nr:XPG I-region protein [Cristinia sonorae]